ncbi:MAG: amidohydrolase [Methanobacteriota archaeon]
MPGALLFLNGPILTMDPERPRAEAVLFSAGRVAAVGSERTLLSRKDAETRVVDLSGRCLVPGFVDAHTHLSRFGAQRARLGLGKQEAGSREQALAAVERRVRATPAGKWVVGHSWDESGWSDRRYLTRAELDRIAPDRPVLLLRVCTHMAVANAAALERLDLAPDHVDAATGLLREAAVVEAVNQLEPPLAERRTLHRGACEDVFAAGITSVHDICDADDVRLWQAGPDLGPQPRATLNLREPLFPHAEGLGLSTSFGNPHVRLGGIKLFLDGSLGARTAAVSSGYAGHPSERGELLYSRDDLLALARKVHRAGLQLVMHAIGDAAIDVALGAVEAAQREHPRADARHRIEHCELASDEAIARMGDLGVVASMQPNFVGNWSGPGALYEQRLGREWHGRDNRMRRMLDHGVALAFGSDGMPYGPLYGVASAVAAPGKEQRISVEEALAAYTRGGAYAGFAEREVGMFREGMLADAVVLPEDPRRAKEIAKVHVDETFLGGVSVYRRRSA